MFLSFVFISFLASAGTVEEELKFSTADEATNETKALKAELLISRNDEKALAQLKKLLAKYKGTPLEASLHFRMAELYMRKAKTATFFEVHRKNEEVVSFSPKETKSQTSKQWVSKAVDTYDFIQSKFTHFRDMDLVLFNNAFARQILGQEKQAVHLYKKVINDFEDSPLVPDSHLAIGEVYYNQKSFDTAYNEFQKIRKYTDARVYSYGLYKGAWALYNLRKTDEALKQLEEVVEYSFAQDEDSRLVLLKEALEDMVVFYEDVKKPSDALSYFKKQSRSQGYGNLIIKLGRLYQRHGKHQYLETVFTDLINDSPLIAERPELHKDLLDSYEIRQKRAFAIEELEKFAQLCLSSSKWFEAQKKETQGQCKEDLIETGKLYAAKWHKEYNKSKVQLQGQYTRRAYEAILNKNTFTDLDKVKYSYAELLFQLTDYRAALKQYTEVSFLTKDSKMKHDSSYAALVSLEKEVKEKWSDQDEVLFSELSGNYIKLNPHGQFLTDVKFKKAFIAYEKNKYDRAAPELKQLAIDYSQTERGKKAATLYLDILNIQKNFAKLKDESFYFIKKLAFDKKTKEEFLKIHQQAYLVVVQELEKSKQYIEASKEYKNFADQNADSELADKAIYNSIRCALLGEDKKLSAQLSEEALKKYPQSTYNVEISKNLVQIYEAFAQLGKAAQILLKIADKEKDQKLKQEFIIKAADYKALEGEYKQAYALYSQFSGVNVLERMVYLQEKLNDWTKTEKLLNQIIQSQVQPQASIASFKIAKKYCEQNSLETCFKLTKQVISQRNDKNVSKWALAQARLEQAKILYSEFVQASLKAKAERISQVIAIKVDKLEKAQKAYQDVINFGDKPTAIEALYGLGRVYSHFSTAMRSIEAPAELSETEKTKFIQEIENMVIPMEEKAAETFELALKQSKALELHDGLIALTLEELNKMSRKKAKVKLYTLWPNPENYLEYSEYPHDCSKFSTKLKSKWQEDLAIKAAHACFAAKEYTVAEDISANLAENSMQSSWGPYLMALIAKEKGNLERAQWMVQLALNRDVKQASSHHLMGQILWIKKDYKKAVESFEKAIYLKSSNPAAYFILAHVYYHDGDYKRAAENYKLALSYNNKNEMALYGLAESELRLKNHDAAIYAYNRLADAYAHDGNYLLRVAEIYENDLHDTKSAISVYTDLKKKIKNGKITKNIDPELEGKLKQLQRQTASQDGSQG